MAIILRLTLIFSLMMGCTHHNKDEKEVAKIDTVSYFKDNFNLREDVCRRTEMLTSIYEKRSGKLVPSELWSDGHNRFNLAMTERNMPDTIFIINNYSAITNVLPENVNISYSINLMLMHGITPNCTESINVYYDEKIKIFSKMYPVNLESDSVVVAFPIKEYYEKRRKLAPAYYYLNKINIQTIMQVPQISATCIKDYLHPVCAENMKKTPGLIGI